MANQIPRGRNPGGSWSIRDPEGDELLLRSSVFLPDGGDQYACSRTAEYDALNPTAAGKRYRKVLAARERALRRVAQRTAKHLRKTSRTRTVVSREKLTKVPRFQLIEAAFSSAVSAAALLVSNLVLAKYVVTSGNELYASDAAGARQFAFVPLFAALGIKAFEHFVLSDGAKNRYVTIFFVIGISTFVLWAAAAGMTFAPSANGMSWLTGAGDGQWTGKVLVLAHILGDAAWGYILIAAAEKVLLAPCKRVEVVNLHYAEAESQDLQAQAEHAACLAELREIDDYLAAIPQRRIKLQARTELELDRAAAQWRVEQAAGLALAHAHFLNRI